MINKRGICCGSTTRGGGEKGNWVELKANPGWFTLQKCKGKVADSILNSVTAYYYLMKFSNRFLKLSLRCVTLNPPKLESFWMIQWVCLLKLLLAKADDNVSDFLAGVACNDHFPNSSKRVYDICCPPTVTRISLWWDLVCVSCS